jgi:hypothetical protein
MANEMILTLNQAPKPGSYHHDLDPDKLSLLQDFFLEQLSFVSMTERQEEVSLAHRKTFEWIFQEPTKDSAQPRHDFATWLESEDPDNIYWINGKPGSGKSTLFRWIYDHEATKNLLQIWAVQSPLILAGFFFWTSGSPIQRSQAGLLRALLYQLGEARRDVIPSLFPALWTKYSKMSTMERVKSPITWSTEDLTSALRICLHLVLETSKVCLFIDGLDEFEGDHGMIIDYFKDLVVLGNGKMKLCVSSRPWPVFQKAFEKVPSFKLQDLTMKDMTQYVRDKLSSQSYVRDILLKDSKDEIDFIVEVVRRSDGVFLWIMLAVRFLLKGSEIEDIPRLYDRLQLLPIDLDELFRYILFDIQGESQIREASQIFHLLRAREDICLFTGDHDAASLTVWELALAGKEFDTVLETPIRQPGVEEIKDLCTLLQDTLAEPCAGLLITHPKHSKSKSRLEKSSESDALQLAESTVTYLHRTVRDFLVQPEIWKTVLSKTQRDPHANHLASCILQLRLPLNGPSRHRRLLEWWPYIVPAMTHARFAAETSSTIVSKLVNKLNETLSELYVVRKEVAGDDWARNAFGSYEERRKTVIYEPFLSLAVKFGIFQYVKNELGSKRIVRHEGKPLLSYAVEFLVNRRYTLYPLSSPELVQLLFEHGADPNQSYKGFTSVESTPWLDVLIYLREGDRRGWIERHDVSDEGLGRWLEILDLFLKNGADPNALILKSKWDPAASALDVISMITEKYEQKGVLDFRDRLVQQGSVLRAKSMETVEFSV